jgi:hypothetical protein
MTTLYSQLMMSLSSLPIILPALPHMLSLGSMCAIVSFQLSSLAIHGITRRYMHFHYYRFLVNGYILLAGFRECSFTHFRRIRSKSTINRINYTRVQRSIDRNDDHSRLVYPI